MKCMYAYTYMYVKLSELSICCFFTLSSYIPHTLILSMLYAVHVVSDGPISGKTKTPALIHF